MSENIGKLSTPNNTGSFIEVSQDTINIEADTVKINNSTIETYIDTSVSNVVNTKFVIVNELPANPDPSIIYLVPESI